MSAVTADAVRKRFSRRGRWVLDRVDLVLRPGTTTLVVGGNGSGKSTLLRILAGASEPTAGLVAGRPRAVGYVPERLPAQIRMTARQYVGHLARIRGMGADAAPRADELFGRLGLSPGPDIPITALSKGNRQKVSLAQAFVAPVGLLVLDEPFSGLDEPAAEALGELVAESGAAVVVSAHSPDGLDADSTYRLTGGRLAAHSRRPAQAMRVTLRLLRPDAVSLDGLAGVIRLDADGGQVTVVTDDADALLRDALSGGWSLVGAQAQEDAL